MINNYQDWRIQENLNEGVSMSPGFIDVQPFRVISKVAKLLMDNWNFNEFSAHQFFIIAYKGSYTYVNLSPDAERNESIADFIKLNKKQDVGILYHEFIHQVHMLAIDKAIGKVRDHYKNGPLDARGLISDRIMRKTSKKYSKHEWIDYFSSSTELSSYFNQLYQEFSYLCLSRRDEMESLLRKGDVAEIFKSSITGGAVKVAVLYFGTSDSQTAKSLVETNRNMLEDLKDELSTAHPGIEIDDIVKEGLLSFLSYGKETKAKFLRTLYRILQGEIQGDRVEVLVALEVATLLRWLNVWDLCEKNGFSVEYNKENLTIQPEGLDRWSPLVKRCIGLCQDTVKRLSTEEESINRLANDRREEPKELVRKLELREIKRLALLYRYPWNFVAWLAPDMEDLFEQHGDKIHDFISSYYWHQILATGLDPEKNLEILHTVMDYSKFTPDEGNEVFRIMKSVVTEEFSESTIDYLKFMTSIDTMFSRKALANNECRKLADDIKRVLA
jgi:hypothetical protein